MAMIEMKCLSYQQTESMRKHGTSQGKRQRYRCLSCHHIFQLEYAYRACQAVNI
ncbi:IS1/IS1595 family N-terminal zinc-binding domain-containing protein [Xenorhabdus siamensis]|uniref:IS1/IS1595 family N-terminal zinc-binding domain-containing protein n=1 Tax=Xenorhabdus siamensis TaxID=3136254 RepID=UPI0030F4A6D2